MDKYVCLKESGVQIGDGDDESSSDDDEDDDDSEEDDDENDDEHYGEGEGGEENEGEDDQPSGLTAVIGIGDVHAAEIVPDDKACSHHSSVNAFNFLIPSIP